MFNNTFNPITANSIITGITSNLSFDTKSFCIHTFGHRFSIIANLDNMHIFLFIVGKTNPYNIIIPSFNKSMHNGITNNIMNDLF